MSNNSSQSLEHSEYSKRLGGSIKNDVKMVNVNQKKHGQEIADVVQNGESLYGPKASKNEIAKQPK